MEESKVEVIEKWYPSDPNRIELTVEGKKCYYLIDELRRAQWAYDYAWMKVQTILNSSKKTLQLPPHMPLDLTEEQIRNTVKEAFNSLPEDKAFIIYTSPENQLAFEKALKDSLEAQGFKLKQ